MNRNLLFIVGLAVILSGLSTPLFSQDIIQLMNGRTVEGKVISIKEPVLTYETKKKNRTRTAELETDRVFSILYGDGHSLVVYVQDTISGGYLSVEDMRYFILGEQDAFRGYKAPVTTIIGFVAGVAGGWYLPYSLGIPLAYTGLNALPRIKIKRKTVSNQDYLKKETYIIGYERVARNKKIQNAVKGSLVGLAAGITTFVVILNKSKEP